MSEPLTEPIGKRKHVKTIKRGKGSEEWNRIKLYPNSPHLFGTTLYNDQSLLPMRATSLGTRIQAKFRV